MDTAAVVERLPGAKRNGAGWIARCPAHEDATPSLSVSTGRDGRTLVHCHAGCSPADIVAALGLTLADLAGESPPNSNGKPRREKVAEYEYTDATGRVLFRRERVEWIENGERRKAVYPHRLDGSRGGSAPVPYRLHQVVAAIQAGGTVLLVEGEKAADALAANGFTSTTTGSATSWRREFAEHFRGARLVLWPDADAPGEEYAAAVARDLVGVAGELRVLRIPGKPSGWDAADYFGEGGTADQLDQLLADAPAWAPDTPARVYITTYATLAELELRPELLAPPPCVLTRIAYRDRATVLAGPPKCGKSMLVSDGSSALTRGSPWLGELVARGRVIWCGLEEATSDAVRRFRAASADPDRIRVVIVAGSDAMLATRAQLDEKPADLLVIDSLTEWARVACGAVPDDGDSAGWAAVIRPLVALAREYHIAVVIIHHVRRSDGQYRGSSEIAAAADAIIEMILPRQDEDQSIRRLRGQGRWPIEPCTLTLDQDDHYQLAGGMPLSLDARVLADVQAHPGTSRRQTRERVGGRASAVDSAVARLVGTGAIHEDRIHTRQSSLYAASDAPTLEGL